ncbi:hypothetical protein QJS10_CPA09g01497 [Acorus calamus]|uniref:Uncharacterized protein n=1 Tax=Acorus calamus TaxID=4465 RepID=A0AAV9E964_ACOCL|nr:hypothetical protein QJS10_CPA09g01497 [Acorus calamus]
MQTIGAVSTSSGFNPFFSFIAYHSAGSNYNCRTDIRWYPVYNHKEQEVPRHSYGSLPQLI